jgi:hypothetical protein
VKREEPYAYNDAIRQQEVQELRSEQRPASKFWRSSFNRTYSMKQRTSRPLFKQEHPADYEKFTLSRNARI